MGQWCWSSLWKTDCSLWEGLVLEKFVENCLPWEEIQTPSLHLPARRKGVDKTGSEGESVKKSGVKRCGLLLNFLFLQSDFVCNRVRLSSEVCFVCGSSWSVVSPCPCLNTWDFHYISLPHPAEEGQQLGGHLAFIQEQATRVAYLDLFGLCYPTSARKQWRK